MSQIPALTAERIARTIAGEIAANPRQVEAATALLDEGATVPFIARYRKEATGGLDDTQGPALPLAPTVLSLAATTRLTITTSHGNWPCSLRQQSRGKWRAPCVSTAR